MIVLIPAYEPGNHLLDLLDELNAELNHPRIVIVDDGSGPDFAPVFEAAKLRGADVLSYGENRGKGFALKYGFAHIERMVPNVAIVCADCDGQHSVADIKRAVEALDSGDNPMVLGARAFTGEVPARSRFGNAVTRLAFAGATRGNSCPSAVSDTQTGLRAYRPEILPWLQSVDGDRFEYELNILLEASRAGVGITEIPIETIYLEQNESSHFRPLVDSARIYWPLIKFSASSLAAFVIDFACLLVFMAISGNLLVSVIAARLVSASMNFMTNQNLVFTEDEHTRAASEDAAPKDRSAAVRYASLVAGLLSANYVMLRILTAASMSLPAAKVLTEITLFIASYQIQRRVVFATASRAAGGKDRTPAHHG